MPLPNNALMSTRAALLLAKQGVGQELALRVGPPGYTGFNGELEILQFMYKLGRIELRCMSMSSSIFVDRTDGDFGPPSPHPQPAVE